MTTPNLDLDHAQAALLALLRRLGDLGYQFTTPTPATHRRVLLRRGFASAETLADVFGWNMAFDADVAPPDLLALMAEAGILQPRGGRFVSGLRVASLGPLLFLHSAFPTGRDAVFFGPDSYRFADFIRAEAPSLAPGARVVDIGTGAGIGGIFAQRLRPETQLTLADINAGALRLAAVNAAFAGLSPEIAHADGLPGEDLFELALANPPYIGAGTSKTYSDGGGALGGEITVDWARAAARRLAPGGRLLLYSGAAIVRGRDLLREQLQQISEEASCAFSYRELDADVFPETLLHRNYWGVERIAAIGAVLMKSL